MYRFLTVGNNNSKDIKTEDANKLFEYLYMEFKDLPEEIEIFLSSIKECEDFILAVLILNRFYKTKRYNYKLKKYSNTGACGMYTTTNRSLVDIGLFANRYNKAFANYIILAKGMAKVLETGGVNTIICSNIRRRVYLLLSHSVLVINGRSREFDNLNPVEITSGVLSNTINNIKQNKVKHNKNLNTYILCGLKKPDELKIQYEYEGDINDGYVIKFCSE